MMFRALITVLAALVRRDKMVLGPAALCEGQDLPCAGLEAGLAKFMAAAQEDVSAFLEAIGLESKHTCGELCQATAAFVETEEGGSFKLPSSKGVICSDDSNCVEVGTSDDQEVSDVQKVGEEAASLLKVEAVSAAKKELQLRFSPQEMAKSLLTLFDIHIAARDVPEDFEDLAPHQQALVEVRAQVEYAAPFEPEFGDDVRRHRYVLYTQRVAKAATLLRTAILRMWRNPNPLRHWLGADIDRQRSSDMDDVRETFQGMLKTILNLKIVKADEDACGGTGVALVKVRLNSENEFASSEKDNLVFRGEMMTRRVYKIDDTTLIGNSLNKGDTVTSGGQTFKITNVHQGSSLIKLDREAAVNAVFVKEGRYVVHVCERFWSDAQGPRSQAEALLREAAHHNGKLQVRMRNGELATGRLGCLALVEEKGSDSIDGALANGECYAKAISVLAQDKI